MSAQNITGQAFGAATPPSASFSPTVIALMVCVPIGVLLLIIVVVCVCVRRGDSGQGVETYEDYSKVDQTVMMRMSMNVIDDHDHVVPPEEINHMDNDLHVHDPVKHSTDLDKCQNGYKELETQGNLSLTNTTVDNDNKKDCGPDGEMNSGSETVEPPGVTTIHKGDNSVEEVVLRNKTKTNDETESDTKQGNGDTVRLVPRPATNTASGEYYTLKANYLPPPE